MLFISPKDLLFVGSGLFERYACVRYRWNILTSCCIYPQHVLLVAFAGHQCHPRTLPAGRLPSLARGTGLSLQRSTSLERNDFSPFYLSIYLVLKKFERTWIHLAW